MRFGALLRLAPAPKGHADLAGMRVMTIEALRLIAGD